MAITVKIMKRTPDGRPALYATRDFDVLPVSIGRDAACSIASRIRISTCRASTPRSSRRRAPTGWRWFVVQQEKLSRDAQDDFSKAFSQISSPRTRRN
jgi:hypothetical protein